MQSGIFVVFQLLNILKLLKLNLLLPGDAGDMPVWKMIIVIVPAPMAKPDNVISKMMKIILMKIMMKMMSTMKTRMKMSEDSMVRRIMTMKIMMRKMTRTMMKMKGIEEVVIEIREVNMTKMIGMIEAATEVAVVTIMMMKITTIGVGEAATAIEEENMITMNAKEQDLDRPVVHAGDLVP